jgi:hydroxyacylglutathione hydrolase
MQLVFEQHRTGGDRNFGYLLGDRTAGTCVLIDPSFSPKMLLERATAQGLRITHILNTHGHPDHTNGNTDVARATKAPVLGGSGSGSDFVLADGDIVQFGSYQIRTWEVPGHSPDHLAFFVNELRAGLTGDHLFVGKVGGTHSEADAKTEWDSLQRLLREWPPETTIWPGHDYGARPSSTMALERISNPFLQCADFAAFLKLKEDWPAFKARYGLR